MKRWEQALVSPQTSLHEALAVIDRSGSQMALVVDAERHLLGTLSDGDIRRALLKGVALGDAVVHAMHLAPVCARAGEERSTILATMRRRGLHQMPVIDDERRVVGLEIFVDFFDTPRRANWVVIMAGGLGTRLGDLTRDTPKPMLPVGSRPLLETIVRTIAEHGFERIYLAVNYRAEQIEAHFGDGRALGLDIRYLREDRALGTAGALSLLPEAPSAPLVVTNADLLTKEDFGLMVERHVESGADATMAVRPYEMQVPFGVVRERDGHIDAIEEKPLQRFVVSAGIYVLSPRVLELVPSGQPLDMPALFESLIAGGGRARCHHVRSYWLDIGRLPDYERANLDFAEVFRVIDGLSVLAIVPARGGSKGLPGKNIRPAAGRPLLDYTVAAARAAACIDRVVLSSDDEEIMRVARACGCEVPFRRPGALATDEAASIDVVLHALDQLPPHDLVVLLQPTSPLRSAADIDGACRTLQQHGAPACVSVTAAEQSPYWMFRMNERAELAPLLPAAERAARRQDLPPVVVLNGAVYVARCDWLRRERSFVAAGTVGYPMPAERSLDIDTAADFETFVRLVS